MRALRTLAAAGAIAVLGVSGAVIAMRLTAPDDARAAQNATSPAAALRTSPAPVVTDAAGAPVHLTVATAGGRTIVDTVVGRLDPVRTGSGFRPIDPPAWNQAVWVRYRPLIPPDDTSRGTSYVYGHACHHHVCSFTRLAQVRPGGTVTVTAGGHSTRYVVTMASAKFPKSGPGSLADRKTGVANRSLTHRIVLITCAYETGDVSLNNFVVVATRATRHNGA